MEGSYKPQPKPSEQAGSEAFDPPTAQWFQAELGGLSGRVLVIEGRVAVTTGRVTTIIWGGLWTEANRWLTEEGWSVRALEWDEP